MILILRSVNYHHGTATKAGDAALLCHPGAENKTVRRDGVRNDSAVSEVERETPCIVKQLRPDDLIIQVKRLFEQSNIGHSLHTPTVLQLLPVNPALLSACGGLCRWDGAGLGAHVGTNYKASPLQLWRAHNEGGRPQCRPQPARSPTSTEWALQLGGATGWGSSGHKWTTSRPH